MKNEKKNIQKILKDLKILKGDTIMVHGDAGVAVQYSSDKDPLNFFFNHLIEYIGNKGNILVPTFTTSFCKKKTFDLKNSRSEIGLFSETFRKRKDTNRISHPIFSFSIYGKKWKYFNKSNIKTCFGKNSVFHLFHKINGKILILGSTFENVTTFAHYIEQSLGIKYRYLKKFNGFIINKRNKKTKITTSYYVRNLTMNKNLKTPRSLYKILNKVEMGRYDAFSVESKKLYNHCKRKIQKNSYYLVN